MWLKNEICFEEDRNQCHLVGKGENAGYQHFLLSPQYFQKASFSRLLKGLCGKGLKELRESMGRCTSRPDIIEIVLKLVYNTVKSINTSTLTLF